jgi:iron-sulfur cluster repair protein YtfE (RIC family)
MGAQFLFYLAKLNKNWDRIDSPATSSKGNHMDQIEEFEQRITVALDKIAAHLDAAPRSADGEDASGEVETLRAENERLAAQVKSLQSELSRVHADRDAETAQVQELYQKLADALNVSEAEDA